MFAMNLSEYSTRDFMEWKATIKETWDEQRTQMIFEGKDAHTTEAGTVDTMHVTMIIGIAIASLLALIFIVLIVIWICRRRRKNDNKRVSIRHLSQSGEPDRVHADTEPVRTHYIEMPSTSFHTSSIPIQKHKRWSSIRNVSVRISRILGMNSKPSVSNDSIVFNKHSESVQVPLLRPAPNFPIEDRESKGRAASRTIQSASRPVMDSDSHILSTSSDVVTEMHQRETVYNPLLRQADSIPYDELVIGTTGSGAHNTDPVIPGYPSDNGANLQNGDQKSHPFFILEKGETIRGNAFLPKVTELECIDEGHCNTISDTSHSFRADDKCERNKEYYNCVFETIERSAGSNYVSTSTNDSAVQTSATS